MIWLIVGVKLEKLGVMPNEKRGRQRRKDGELERGTRLVEILLKSGVIDLLHEELHAMCGRGECHFWRKPSRRSNSGNAPLGHYCAATW
jgi:hypothetical protein